MRPITIAAAILVLLIVGDAMAAEFMYRDDRCVTFDMAGPDVNGVLIIRCQEDADPPVVEDPPAEDPVDIDPPVTAAPRDCPAPKGILTMQTLDPTRQETEAHIKTNRGHVYSLAFSVGHGEAVSFSTAQSLAGSQERYATISTCPGIIRGSSVLCREDGSVFHAGGTAYPDDPGRFGCSAVPADTQLYFNVAHKNKKWGVLVNTCPKDEDCYYHGTWKRHRL
jgi:hypothetical protein